MAVSGSGSGVGLLENLARLSATLLAVAHTRLQILSVDLSEGRERLVELLFLTLSALLLLGTGVVLATIALVLAASPEHRLLVIAVAAIGYLICGGAVFALTLRKARALPPVLNTSLTELEKDREQLARRL